MDNLYLTDVIKDVSIQLLGRASFWSAAVALTCAGNRIATALLSIEGGGSIYIYYSVECMETGSGSYGP